MNIGTREDLSVLRFRKGGSACYFSSGILGAAAGTVALTVNTLVAIPFFVAKTEKFDRISINVTTAGAAGTKARLGIYADNGTTAPGRLILDAGEVAVDSTGVKEITILQELFEKQLYWLAIVSSGAPALRTVARGSLYFALLGVQSALGTDFYTYMYRSFTYAALPDPFGAPTISTGIPPAVCLRKV